MAAPTVHGSQCHGQQVAEYLARVLVGKARDPWAGWGMGLMESVGILCVQPQKLAGL